MKHPMKAAALALLLTIASSLWAQTPAADSLTTQGRIANLELMRDNLSHELQLHKQELASEIHRTNIYVLLSIATLIFGAGWIFWGVRNVRTQVVSKAEAYLDSELKKQLPVTMRKRLQELFEHVIPQEIEPFLKLIREKKLEDEMKASRKIVLLAETLERGKEAEKDFRESGFRDVSIHLPESDDLPLANLYVFIRREPKPDNGWSKLSDTYIKRVLDQNRKDDTRGFFYYGPYNDAMDPKMHPRFGLANMPSTLAPRIIELLSKPSTSIKP
jgi:hypothetical protein